MKTTMTLLALLFAGVIHLQAQEPTANEAAWSALVTAKKTEAAASPEAVAIKDSIMAGAAITRTEIFAVSSITRANGGEAAYKAAFRTIAESTKSGEGVSWVRACVKYWDGDMSGWTEDILDARPGLAATLAMRPGATPQFKADVWAVFMTRSAHEARPFFKAYRSTLPKATQIEATQKQKDLVLAIPTRDAAANAWLAEVSADLVALQLDQ
jgi:phage tail protein X